MSSRRLKWPSAQLKTKADALTVQVLTWEELFLLCDGLEAELQGLVAGATWWQLWHFLWVSLKNCLTIDPTLIQFLSRRKLGLLSPILEWSDQPGSHFSKELSSCMLRQGSGWNVGWPPQWERPAFLAYGRRSGPGRLIVAVAQLSVTVFPLVLNILLHLWQGHSHRTHLVAISFAAGTKCLAGTCGCCHSLRTPTVTIFNPFFSIPTLLCPIALQNRSVWGWGQDCTLATIPYTKY